MPSIERSEPVKVLTIAGSDSGGAAGLQADLKTFTALGAYGMSVVTAVTAQNSLRVEGIHPIPTEFILSQIKTVLADYGALSIKTGFIGRVDVIRAVSAELKEFMARADGSVFLVVDPVLVNHKGESMFSPKVVEAYVEYLLPLAHLVTPNLEEAELLTGLPVSSLAMIESAAKKIHTLGSDWVLIKGARSGRDIVDLLFDGRQISLLRGSFIDSRNTHGSGDTLSAAICVLLAQGFSTVKAVNSARDFTAGAIRKATHWRLGSGHGPVSHL